MIDREILKRVKKYIAKSQKVIDDMDPDEMMEQEEEDLGHGYYNAASEVLRHKDVSHLNYYIYYDTTKPFVFWTLNRNGKYISGNTLAKALKSVREELGLKDD